MFNRTADGSNDNEAVKIVNALKPFWKKWTDEWGRNCVRSKKMTVTTAPSVVTGLIGVTDAFSDTECMIPYKGDVALAQAGDTVWVKWMYDNQQTMYAECMGNIVKPVGTSNSTPYFYRPSGGGALGTVNRETDKLIGGTVAWNQFAPSVESGNYLATSNATLTFSNGVATIHADAAAGTQIYMLIDSSKRKKSVIGHKYLFVGTVQTQNGVLAFLPTGTSSHGLLSYAQYSTKSILSYIWSAGVEANISATFKGYTGGASISSAIDFTVEKFNAFDLTAMFGSAIADYAYTLESGTAGAGVAWLKSYGFFTKPYYPYAAASLQSVKTSAHKTIGFNQWDEVWEVGGIVNNTGATYTGSDRIRSKNFCRCVPNTTYYGKSPSQYLVIYWYDASKGYIGYEGASNKTITSPQNAAYFKIVLANGVTTYNNDICINLHWDGERDGEYEPYEQHTYALDDVELRGIPKLDASNNLYYDGDEYTPDGTVTRKFGIIAFNGAESENWSYTATMNRVIINLPLALAPASGYVNLNFIADRLVADNTQRDFNAYINNYKNLVIYAPSSITSAADWKTWLSSNPIDLVYELATPTTESADPYQQTQIVNASGTEQYVDASYTAGTRDFEMPVGHDTEYYVLQSFEQQIYDTPQTDGTYRLICKVVNGEASLEWVRDDVTVVQNPITNELFIY